MTQKRTTDIWILFAESFQTVTSKYYAGQVLCKLKYVLSGVTNTLGCISREASPKYPILQIHLLHKECTPVMPQTEEIIYCGFVFNLIFEFSRGEKIVWMFDDVKLYRELPHFFSLAHFFMVSTSIFLQKISDACHYILEVSEIHFKAPRTIISSV